MRVTPRAGRDEVAGWRDGVLQVRLHAPPVEGKANEALRRCLADLLGVAPSRVEIVTGTTARNKRVRVEGVSAEELKSRLGG